MKNSPENSGSDALSKVLQEWNQRPSLPPGFQASVWRRVDALTRATSEPSLLRDILAWMNQLVARPQLAFAYVAFLAMIGMTLGWSQGQREVARVQEGLADRYVQTLDPYQVPRR